MDHSSSSLSLQVSSSLTSTATTQAKYQQQFGFHHPESLPSLHVIRKPPAKPWRKPAQPPAPKVYRVDPHGFRRLVQQLTGMSSTDQPAARLQPPAPIQVGPQPVQHVMNNRAAAGGRQEQQSPAGMKGLMSPSFYSNLCSFPLLSPGSMAALEY